MTSGNFEVLRREFHPFRNKGILLDTNLLLLLVVGLTDSSLISDFKLTANHGFQIRDFEALQAIVSEFRKLATTPHILTEISNHADKLKGESKSKFCEKLKLLVNQCEERCPKSDDLCGRDDFIRFGLTDIAIKEIASGNFYVLTVDHKLAVRLKQNRLAVMNFNHCRDWVLS